MDTIPTQKELKAFYDEIFETYYRLIFWLAYGRRRDYHAAEDTVNEVFLRAWRVIDKLYVHQNVKAWLTRTAKNVLADEYKKSRRVDAAMEEIGRRPPELPPEQDDSLERLFESMRPQDREIIELFCRDNKSLQECADILGISLDAAKGRSSRAQLNLAKIGIKRGKLKNFLMLCHFLLISIDMYGRGGF